MLTSILYAQDKFLIVNRSANLYSDSTSSSLVLEHLKADVELGLLNEGKQFGSGWYHVIAPSGTKGYVYRTRVRGRTGISSIVQRTLSSSNDWLRKDYMPEIGNEDRLVFHEGYISSMNSNHNVPNWVYHHISHEQVVEGDEQKRKRPGSYYRDPDYENLKSNALRSTGYDHGHLAPAGDFKIDSSMYAESFYMTNMSPQNGCMNQKGWCLLESNVREWARNRISSDFYIISGSIFANIIDTLCLPSVEIHVPAQYFKVIMETKHDKLIGAAAYIIDNGDVNGTSISSLSTTIDEVEKATGINFFPNLSTGQEVFIEGRNHNYSIENLSECGKRNTDCDIVYKGRVTPDNRLKYNCEVNE